MYCEKKTRLSSLIILPCKSPESPVCYWGLLNATPVNTSLNIMPILSYVRLSRLPTDPKTNLQNHSSTSTTLALRLFSLFDFFCFRNHRWTSLWAAATARLVAWYELVMDLGLLLPYPDSWAHSREVSCISTLGLPHSFSLWKDACKAKGRVRDGVCVSITTIAPLKH